MRLLLYALAALALAGAGAGQASVDKPSGVTSADRLSVDEPSRSSTKPNAIADQPSALIVTSMHNDTSVDEPSVFGTSELNSTRTKPTVEQSIEAGDISVVQPSVDQPSVVQPSVDQPSVVQPSVVQPSVVQPSVVQPSVVQPSVVQPSVVQSSVVTPSVDPSSVVSPSAPPDVFPRVSGSCPPGCRCGPGDGDWEYTCTAGNSTYKIKALPNDYARIECKNGALPPSSMPPLPLSAGGTLSSVSLRTCAPPHALSDVLTRLGARGVSSLALVDPRGELEESLAGGMEEVTMLMITEAESLRRVPWRLVRALPTLRDFRIRDANITLQELSDEEAAALAPAPSLRLAELSLSNITRLPRGCLAPLRHVTSLHLFGNEIQQLTPEGFAGLDNVETLDLSRNPFPGLPARVFISMPRLRSLTLVVTQLTTVDSDAFAGLQLFEKLVVKYNQGLLQWGAHSLGSLPSLKYVSLEHCRLAELPPDLLRGSTALEELNITNSHLPSIPEALFSGLSRLRYLDLRGNRLRSLPGKVFWSLTALEVLRLDGNRLVELPSQLFSGLSRLRVFTAESNRLRHVAADALQGAAALQEVSLSDNQLTLRQESGVLPMYMYLEQSSPFAELLQLRQLRLARNNISEMFSDWHWQLVHHLRLLDLSHNNFTELTQADLQFLGSNLTVDLRHNRVTHIQLLPALPGVPSNDHRGNVLLLDDNPFSCDCLLYTFIKRLEGSEPNVAEPRLDPGTAVCHSPPSLAGRPLLQLPADALSCSLQQGDCPDGCVCGMRPATMAVELDCESLPGTYPDPVNLSLTQTYLKLHQDNSLSNLRLLPDHVTVLNLTGAGLRKTPQMKVLKNIKTLDVSHNDLTSIPRELLASNITLYLSGNPFTCDCSHQEDVMVMQKYVKSVGDRGRVMCSGGEPLWNVDAARLCDVRRATLIGSSLAVLGIVIAILAALAYRYMLEIKLFLFSRGWCRSLIHEEEIDKAAEYDAFVSFSQEDARWVSETLVPMLEGEHKFKLCVHYRDWVIGDMIPAQIARSVEQSRRTIIVLSENFLKSTWASMEFNVAHLRAQKERRARVLVIVLGDLPEQTEMNAELRAYLTTNTYLKWGDPWFWEKLRYAMPHKKNGLDKLYCGAHKLKRGALNAYINADGKIANDTTLSTLNTY